eukprot:6191816-Pleurochrysis_carterae.AAC.5
MPLQGELFPILACKSRQSCCLVQFIAALKDFSIACRMHGRFQRAWNTALLVLKGWNCPANCDVKTQQGRLMWTRGSGKHCIRDCSNTLHLMPCTGITERGSDLFHSTGRGQPGTGSAREPHLRTTHL